MVLGACAELVVMVLTARLRGLSAGGFYQGLGFCGHSVMASSRC